MQLVGEMPSTRAAVVGVEVEHDAQRDHLALAGGQSAASAASSSGERPSAKRSSNALVRRGELLAPRAAALGAEVVERDGARDLAEPGPRRAARGVEAVPEPQRALERLAGQVLGDAAVAGEPGEVAVDVVEVRLGSLAKASSHVFYAAGRPTRHTRTCSERRVTQASGLHVRSASSARAARAASGSPPAFGPLLLDPRHLEVGGEVLERRVGEERAEALAHLALEDVRVPVAVRAERRRAVVDVQRAQRGRGRCVASTSSHERVDERRRSVTS